MVRAQPARQQLQRALAASGSRKPLDVAMQFPALAVALRNAAGVPTAVPLPAPGRRLRAPTVDMRSRAANDDTDKDL